jgi:hypothetical protein
MSKAENALRLVERLATLKTPEEEFEERKASGDADVEEYDDADEMIADMGDDRLFEEYHVFMEFVEEAKAICAEEDKEEEK